MMTAGRVGPAERGLVWAGTFSKSRELFDVAAPKMGG
jgi:hypothetical protein